jgi:MFS family permease
VSAGEDRAAQAAEVRLVAAATISNLGSMLTRIALPFVAVDVLGASAREMSGLNAARVVPALALGLAVASFVDRRRKRGLLIASDLGHAALLAAVPAAHALGVLSMPLLWLFALASGLLSLVFEVARHAYVAALVARERLVLVNSRITAGNAAAEAFAFAAGGWLVQWLTAPLALLADALSYLASAACLGGIRAREPEPAGARGRYEQDARGAASEPDDRPRPAQRGPASPWLAGAERSRVAGLRAIRASPELFALAWVGAAGVLANEVLGVVYMLFVRRELGFSPGTLGMLFAVGSLASLGASFLAVRVGRALGPRAAMGVSLGVAGLAVAALALAPGATSLGAALIALQQLGDAGFVVFEIHALSRRQAAAPAELQGRIHGTFSFLSSWAMLAGALLGGLLGDVLGPRATIALAGGAFVALALVWWAFAPKGDAARAAP